MIRDTLKSDILKVSKKLGLNVSDVELVHPGDLNNGDYSTNIALRRFTPQGKLQKGDGQDKQSPVEFANKMADSLKTQPYIEKLEVAGPGFINFFIKPEILLNEVENILKKKKIDLGLPAKKVTVEFTDPNPFKEFHIGHLFSNIVGESISRLLEATGATVKRANYQGDVGMHVAKTIWGIPRTLEQTGETFEDQRKKPLKARAFFLGQAYSLGAEQFEASEEVKKEVADLNKKIFERDPQVYPMYEEGRKWSLDYFEEIYKRLGTKFDFYYLESEVGKVGQKIVEDNLKKGIFVRSDGAIIFPGEKFGLHNRVFINSLGLPTYEAKELGLAPTKYKDFPYDLSIIVTGNEIKDYFKVLLAALAQILPDLAQKTKHISHGMVRMPGGKMSSRLGNVILGEWLLDEAKKRVKIEFSSVSDQLAEEIATGAVKYSLLKGNVGQEVNFSFEESISLNGNSGPYLQYTYARCKSVLGKVENKKANSKSANFAGSVDEDELKLLRALCHFEEAVADAAFAFAPNAVANFLHDVAQKYNSLYNNLQILKAGEPERSRRLFLTQATADVLAKGLWLLGISAPEKM
jgi:arginyl-tRNA synthetase